MVPMFIMVYPKITQKRYDILCRSYFICTCCLDVLFIIISVYWNLQSESLKSSLFKIYMDITSLQEVTPENFLKILQGEDMEGVGSGKTIKRWLL